MFIMCNQATRASWAGGACQGRAAIMHVAQPTHNVGSWRIQGLQRPQLLELHASLGSPRSSLRCTLRSVVTFVVTVTAGLGLSVSPSFVNQPLRRSVVVIQSGSPSCTPGDPPC